MQFDLSKRFTQLLFFFILALSIALQWYGHQCGLLLTTDSYNYLSAAQSFKTDGIFLSTDGGYFVFWPPLFPMIISCFDNPMQALPWVNFLVTIFIGLLVFNLANKFFITNIFKVFFLLITLCSVQFILISVFIWSELIFLFLVLIVIYCALKLNVSVGYWSVLIISGFLMCLQRNAGMFIMAGICLWILVDHEKSFGINLGRSFIIFVMSVSGLIAWNIYLSYLLPFGSILSNQNLPFGFLSNFGKISYSLLKTFAPISSGMATLPGLFLFAVLVIMFWSLSKKNRGLQLCMIIILVYWIGFVLVMPEIDVRDVDRFFSIVMPLVVFLWMYAVERIYLRQRQKPWKALIPVLIVLWTIYPLARTVKNVLQWNGMSCSVVATK